LQRADKRRNLAGLRHKLNDIAEEFRPKAEVDDNEEEVDDDEDDDDDLQSTEQLNRDYGSSSCIPKHLD